MSAMGLFFISAILCGVGCFAAIFIVTTRGRLNAWVSTAFLMGVVINLLFIAILTAKSS
jgi:uncharacterized MnhB-related membrane protein